MKAAELREMSDEQLQLTLKDSTESLFRLRVQAQTERLDAPSELKRHRQIISRAKTIQRQRELERVFVVTAQFLGRSDGLPLTGDSYVARIFAGDVFADESLGEAKLDHLGRTKVACDLTGEARKEKAEKFLDQRPQITIVLEKEGTEVFRSRGFKNLAGRPSTAGVVLGKFKV